MMKKLLRRLLPRAAKRKMELIRERYLLSKVQTKPPAETEMLLRKEEVTFEEAFCDDRRDELWAHLQKQFAGQGITPAAGGVNPGDRRALFYLVSYFKPSSILEIGTHIGASTAYLACALRLLENDSRKDLKLTTVDILDVNSPEGPWRQVGEKWSPMELLQFREVANLVEFVEARSLDYLEGTTETFDFIFLDGDHSAATVYQEVHAALSCLRPGGVILLHDYFPECKAIWSNGAVKPGPYLALQRLIREGPTLKVAPLGGLPWSTKEDSNLTSLALLLGKS